MKFNGLKVAWLLFSSLLGGKGGPRDRNSGLGVLRMSGKKGGWGKAGRKTDKNYLLLSPDRPPGRLPEKSIYRDGDSREMEVAIVDFFSVFRGNKNRLD